MKKLSYPFAFIIFTAAVAAPSWISAQTACTGGGCQYLPLNYTQLQAINDSIRDQYLKEVMTDMSKAALIANLSTIPAGTVNQNGYFMAGTGLSAGYLHRREINNVTVANVGTFNNLPSLGVGAVPRIYLGANAGRMIGLDYDPLNESGSPSLLSPLRFDIYLTGFKYTYTIKPEQKTDPLTYKVKPGNSGYVRMFSRGGEIRYHVFEAGHILSPLLRFNGMSAGIGFYQSVFEVNYLMQAGQGAKLKMDLSSGNVLEWDGINNVIYLAKVNSVPVELKTGIQFLSFLNLTAGVGYSRNTGSSSISLLRSGAVKVRSKSLDDALAQLQQMSGQTPAIPDAILSMHIRSEEKVPKNQAYGKAGIEFDIWIMKIAFEGIYVNKNAYGLHFGIRAEI